MVSEHVIEQVEAHLFTCACGESGSEAWVVLHQTGAPAPEQPAAEQPAALEPESLKALADKVVDEHFIPKKVPDPADIDGQTAALGGALASALLTATEMPISTLQPIVGDLAAQMVALGIRQTEHVDPQAVHTPAWITDGMRQESIKLPPQPEPTEVEPVEARTAQAPTPPKRIPKAGRAVRQQ